MRHSELTAVILALGLVSTMLIVTVGNVITLQRCATTFDRYVEKVEISSPETPPIVCDTTGELVVVLDIGLALSGGLVGYLAATQTRKNDEEEVTNGQR